MCRVLLLALHFSWELAQLATCSWGREPGLNGEGLGLLTSGCHFPHLLPPGLQIDVSRTLKLPRHQGLFLDLPIWHSSEKVLDSGSSVLLCRKSGQESLTGEPALQGASAGHEKAERGGRVPGTVLLR